MNEIFNKEIKNFENATRILEMGAGETAQQVKARTALAENPGSVSNTHMMVHNCLQFQGIKHNFLGFRDTVHLTTHTYIKQKKIMCIT